jgi:hypothetical protein
MIVLVPNYLLMTLIRVFITRGVTPSLSTSHTGESLALKPCPAEGFHPVGAHATPPPLFDRRWAVAGRTTMVVVATVITCPRRCPGTNSVMGHAPIARPRARNRPITVHSLVYFRNPFSDLKILGICINF